MIIKNTAVSPSDLKTLIMLGQYIGISLKTYNVVPISLPTIFWTYLREGR